jgi:hypothetical protein
VLSEFEVVGEDGNSVAVQGRLQSGDLRALVPQLGLAFVEFPIIGRCR